MRRRGLTFVEIMVVVVIGTLLIMIVVQWQARFSSMFGSAVADLALQSDARILFDNLSQDLTSAVLVGSGKDEKIEDFDFKPDAGGQSLSIVRLKKDPKGRHVAAGDPKKPQYAGSPHYTDNGEPVVQVWPAVRAIYEVEQEPQQGDKKTLRVFRTEYDGSFTRTEEKPKCDRENAWSYKFSGKAGRRQQMATRVTKLVFVPLAFMPEKPPPFSPQASNQPQTPDPNAPAAVPGFIPPSRFLTVWGTGKPCAQLYQISAIGVHYASEDVKIGAKGREGRVELVSKFWIEERSAAYRFNQAFSSIDESL